MPISQPRTEPYLADETDYRVTAAPSLIDPVTGIPVPQGIPMVTTQGDNRTTQPLGPPNALEAVPNQFGSGPSVVAYGPTLSVLSLVSDGLYTVTATCSAPHGLATNSQVSVEGASFNGADGAYSVIVNSPMVFSYTTIDTVPQGGLLTGGTKVWTLLAGLPRGYDQIPQTGIGRG